MANDELTAKPLTSSDFAPFGEIISTSGAAPVLINDGHCRRYHALSIPQLVDVDGADVGIGISLFEADAYTLPLSLSLVERHPLASQTFIPMSSDPFLVIVCDDDRGVPVTPQVFLTNGRQGITYQRNIWHGVLTPINRAALFAVVDYVGSRDNLQEYRFSSPFSVITADESV